MLANRLRPFVPYPHDLIDIVTRNGAVFGGEVALAFFMRTDPYTPSTLEIYASNFQFDKLCEAIINDPEIRARTETHSMVTHSFAHALRRLVAETMVIQTTDGATIYVHQSYTSSPSASISRSVCTALSNFVTGRSFGCSHPRLTLARRAILADRDIMYLTPHDAQSVNHLITFQFSTAISPTEWPEHRDDDQDDVDHDISDVMEQC